MTDYLRPMAGLRVLDFSIMMAGPYCSRMMADLGADVLKVEPAAGDPMRGGLPRRAAHSAYFAHLNAGKRSVVLDLTQEDARHAARELAAEADVLVQNFRPGVADRLGIGYEKLRERNPRLIYCSISGYGQTGPDAARAAFAPIVHAGSGLDLAAMQHQHADKPLNTGIFTADVLTAMYALIGVQAALAARARAGVGAGTHVDVTLFESMLNLMPFEVQEAQFPLAAPRPVYEPVRAQDGFLMIVVITDRNFENLCAAIGRPELRSDPRFAASRERSENRAALMAAVQAWTVQRSAVEGERTLGDAGVPCGRYRSVREALDDPVLAHRASLAAVHDAAGELLVPKLPFRFGDLRPGVQPGVPGLGEHTAQALSGAAWLAAGPQFHGRASAE